MAENTRQCCACVALDRSQKVWDDIVRNPAARPQRIRLERSGLPRLDGVMVVVRRSRQQRDSHMGVRPARVVMGLQHATPGACGSPPRPPLGERHVRVVYLGPVWGPSGK